VFRWSITFTELDRTLKPKKTFKKPVKKLKKTKNIKKFFKT